MYPLYWTTSKEGIFMCNILCAIFYVQYFYVQYRNVLSVRILAKISPSGNAATISIADANQDADADNDIIPRL